MNKLFFISFLFIAFFSRCKTAGKAYQKGEYTEAIEIGVKKLQKNPADLETSQLIRKSYAYEVNDHEDQIRIMGNNKSDDRFDQIYQQYNHLQHLYQIIHEYPAIAEIIPVKDYSSYLNTYAGKAAQIHTERASNWMSDHTKPSYREAYKEYNIALSYDPGNFDLRRNRDIAYDHALTKVIVTPIRNYQGFDYASSTQLHNFQNDIIRLLTNNMNNSLVKFYTEWEAQSLNIMADQVMEINVGRIYIENPFMERDTKEVSKNVVVKEIVYKPDSVIKQYAPVYATIITTKTTLVSHGDLYITVRDMVGKIIWNDRFTGEYKWQTKSSAFTGDERALKDEDKNLCSNISEQAPHEERIHEELLRQVQTELYSRLRNYYGKY